MKLARAMASLCVAVSILGTGTFGQEPPKPGAEQKILAADEGTWDATIKMFAPGSSEPQVSKGTEVNEMMPGGMWLLSKFDGEFGGMKFHGRGQFSYDSAKKKYIGTWIDSMAPALAMLEGSYDAKTKTMTYTGDGVDPDGKQKYTQKMVTTTKDDGTRVFTLFMKYEGAPNEMKLMEITYTKKK